VSHHRDRPDRDRPDRDRPDQPRLFIAVPIPEEVGIEIGRVMDDTRRAVGPDAGKIRWVQLDGLHVTIRFLGPTQPARVDEVAAALDRAAGGDAAFEVRFAGAGAFPTPDRPRALWLGIRDGADVLGSLAAALETELRAAGWDLESRPYRPHLTIARTDGVRAGPAAARALEAAAAGLDSGFIADRVILYRSHLGSGPARYQALHEVRLS
jgi:2'-5' RNA ligase